MRIWVHHDTTKKLQYLIPALKRHGCVHTHMRSQIGLSPSINSGTSVVNLILGVWVGAVCLLNYFLSPGFKSWTHTVSENRCVRLFEFRRWLRTPSVSESWFSILSLHLSVSQLFLLYFGQFLTQFLCAETGACKVCLNSLQVVLHCLMLIHQTSHLLIEIQGVIGMLM